MTALILSLLSLYMARWLHQRGVQAGAEDPVSLTEGADPSALSSS